MNITVSVLSRPNIDAAFTQLVAPVVLPMAGASLGWTPPLPANSQARELQLRVFSTEAVKVMVGSYLDPAHPPQPTPLYDGNGVLVGETPAPTPTVVSEIGVWGGQTRDIPFSARQSVLFCATSA